MAFSAGFNPNRFRPNFRDALEANEQAALERGCPECGAPCYKLHGKFSVYVECTSGHMVQPASYAAGKPEPSAKTPSAPAPTPTPSESEALATLRALLGSSVNPEQVKAIVQQELGSVAPAILEKVSRLIQESGGARPVAITVRDLPPVKIETAHKLLPEIVKRAALMDGDRPAFPNLRLVGPAGSGKTILAEQLALALGFDLETRFATISAGLGVMESAFVGRVVPSLTDGTERYWETAFVRIYRDGGVFLLDEADNMDPSTVLVLNGALANGYLTLPNGVRVRRHAECYIILAMNTWGHGESREYVGRTQLDGAFLDRFVGCSFFMDYDADLEKAICPNKAVRERVWDVRQKCRDLKLRRIVSTRMVKSLRSLVDGLDMSISDGLRDVLCDWSESDRKAVGVN